MESCARGQNLSLLLDTIKLFFELIDKAFIDVDVVNVVGEIEVKELKDVHDNIEHEIDDECDLQWSVELRSREE